MPTDAVCVTGILYALPLDTAVEELCELRCLKQSCLGLTIFLVTVRLSQCVFVCVFVCVVCVLINAC